MFDASQRSSQTAARSDLASAIQIWDQEAVAELIECQERYFASGETLAYPFRRLQLEKLRRVIKSYEADIVTALRQDLHKSPSESFMTEIGVALNELSEALKYLRTWMRPEPRRTPLMLFPARSEVRREPFGRCLIMSPWNFPFLLNIGPIIAALAAGNVVIVKPSELAPNIARVLNSMLSEAFPRELLAVVEGDAQTSTLLLAKRWDFICFTGGTEVGRLVALAAAQHLTPCILELGGKSPCIVTDKANLRIAARRISWGKFINAGQTCVAPDYILALDSVYEELLENLQKEIQLSFGLEPLQNPQWPKIINSRHFERLLGLIDPAKVVVGGKSNQERQQIEPTLLREINCDDPLMREEIFGPLLPVLRVPNLGAAIDFVKKFEKPLALYLFSEDQSEQEIVAQRLAYGGGCMNDVLVHTGNSELPFGGVGQSGMGAYHGRYGFEAFSHRKSLLFNKTRFDPPLRYAPWNKFKDQAFRLFLR